MKRILACVLFLLLIPACASAREWMQEMQDVLAELDIASLQAASDGLDVQEMLEKLVRGEVIMSAEETLAKLLQQAAGVFRKSIWRMTRLMVPALLTAAVDWLRPGASGKAAQYAGTAMTMAFLVADLREHAALAVVTVGRLADWMQALFPLMVTLLTAVGGAAGSAFYQPAVMAAAGSMTTLLRQLTMPLAIGTAVLTMVDGLSGTLRLGRMCRLFRQAACWTLGFGFTVFIGVMTVQGVSMAALDGISLRTAKFAVDRFVPIVGGMFSDTVDTLVGCSLVIQHAVGTLGLIVLLGMLLAPLVRTVMTMFLYRASAALLEPVSDGPLCRVVGGYADVFSLLFTIQLSAGAMFLLLVAQLVAAADITVMLR